MTEPLAVRLARTQEPLTDAYLRIIQTQLERLHALEGDARIGADPESIHKLRVAVRRLRSALRLLRPYYDARHLRRLRAPVDMLAAGLGEVRDLDIALEPARAYLNTLPEERRRALDPMVWDWTQRRRLAQRSVTEFLDHDDYRRGLSRLRSFARSDSSARGGRLCDSLPAVVWSHYGAVRRFEPSMQDAPLLVLHALRIEIKRLRYLLEFFEEVLDERASVLAKQLADFQGNLGALHDAGTLADLVAAFVAAQTQQMPSAAEGALVREAALFREAIAADIQALRVGCLEPWRSVSGQPFRAALAKVTAAL
jgi:CHAD domain-containing protein